MQDAVREVSRIAQLGGNLLRELLGKVERSEVEHKGPVDLVTWVDRESELVIRDQLVRSFPGTRVLGEEISPREDLTGEVWLVDPLDGTTNFVHGHPVYCVSIALARDRALELGVIYAPSLGELYTAARGSGAFLNERRLAVSRTVQLGESLLATGFAALRRPSPIDNVPEFAYLIKRVEGIRRAGSAALDLAFVASGRLDGYWEYNLSPWDIAAGSLMVEEAGGRVTDIAGRHDYLTGQSITASNGLIHSPLLLALERATGG